MHLIPSPDDGMDQLLAHGIIATTIPEIRLRGAALPAIRLIAC